MYLIKLSCGPDSKQTILFDDAPTAQAWLTRVERRLAAEGAETVRPSSCVPGRVGLAVMIHDRVVVATGRPVDASVLKEYVRAPDWCIKLMLELSPN